MSTYAINRAALALVQEQLDDASIEAPFDGIVGARHVSMGQFVTPGTALTWLIDPDPMKVEFRVPERYIGQVQPRQEITVRVDSYPDQTFRGEVYFIAPEIDPDTRTGLVKAIIPNREAQLRRGMFANVSIGVGQRDDAVVIPETAVVHSDQSTTVYVVENDQAQPRPVRLGARLPGHVEVIEGIAPHELVVIEGIQKLRPGAQVVVRSPESSAATTKPPAPAPHSTP
jgi:membrane fusion protein (multidrug efflux system)